MVHEGVVCVPIAVPDRSTHISWCTISWVELTCFLVRAVVLRYDDFVVGKTLPAKFCLAQGIGACNPSVSQVLPLIAGES